MTYIIKIIIFLILNQRINDVKKFNNVCEIKLQKFN